MVAGCSSASSTGDSGSTATTTDIAKVEVSGKPDAKPTVNAHAPFSVTKTTNRLITTGQGWIAQTLVDTPARTVPTITPTPAP